MAQEDTSTTYLLLANMTTADLENLQALASAWGEIQTECAEAGAEIQASYAVLGQYDFMAIVRAPSRDVALQCSIIMGRQGLDVQTLGLIPTEQFSHMVEDV